jgi:hypothetical protein
LPLLLIKRHLNKKILPQTPSPPQTLKHGTINITRLRETIVKKLRVKHHSTRRRPNTTNTTNTSQRLLLAAKGPRSMPRPLTSILRTRVDSNPTTIMLARPRERYLELHCDPLC